LKTIITLLLILLAMHACQCVTERYALEKTTSQSKKTHNQETTKQNEHH
jgi:hypothetical protein